jgi:hypothetical protein
MEEVVTQGTSPRNYREVDQKLRKQYLGHLNQKVKIIRRLLVERNWELLRSECSQVASGGATYGFQKLSELARQTQEEIPPGKVSRACAPGYVKHKAEGLIFAMDAILMEDKSGFV